MIIVLLAAALVAGILGEVADTIAIICIVLLNAVFGFVQEYRAEQALEALQNMLTPVSTVLRNGVQRECEARDIVPGDIVSLSAGQRVTADIRLLKSADIGIEEAALTGESIPVSKRTAVVSGDDIALGDQENMAFSGTLVTRGHGMGVVVATGMNTELGRIAGLLGTGGLPGTPLQKRLELFGKRLAIAILVICLLIFIGGVLRGEEVLLMLLTAVSLAVAAVPEALPAVVTISLALGARRMVRQNALVRRLPSVETLGSVTYICSDKTGTLTENRMHAERFYTAGVLLDRLPEDPGAQWRDLVANMQLNVDASIDDSGNAIGDPTEVALLVAARKRDDADHTVAEFSKRQAEWPFDSTRKCMTTAYEVDGQWLTLSKGAPEVVIEACRDQLCQEGLGPIDTAALNNEAIELANSGYRVLAFAQKHHASSPVGLDAELVEKNMTFVGLVAMLDPPRKEIAQAVKDCNEAGITSIMITGDHPATAEAIARRLGISDPSAGLLTGAELNHLSEAEFSARVKDTRVYARVSPEHKIRIVKALQAHGEYVAMTGDGVNDAPALHSADIGIAMGRVGTDVAREAADMVLLDDNFASIVRSVREGRRIYDNIRKFIKYTMTSNSGEIWVLFLAPFLGLPIPLLPIHILWINLVTDGLPGLALSTEPAERGVMARPPRPPKERIFANGMWQHMLWVGLLIGALSLFAQGWAINQGSENWQTMVFTVLTLSQLVHALAIRSEKDSLFRIGFFSNPMLMGSLLLTLGLQMMIIYIPFLQPIFHTSALSPGELAICLTLPWVVLLVVEGEKWAARRGWLYKVRAGQA